MADTSNEVLLQGIAYEEELQRELAEARLRNQARAFLAERGEYPPMQGAPGEEWLKYDQKLHRAKSAVKDKLEIELKKCLQENQAEIVVKQRQIEVKQRQFDEEFRKEIDHLIKKAKGSQRGKWTDAINAYLLIKGTSADRGITRFINDELIGKKGIRLGHEDMDKLNAAMRKATTKATRRKGTITKARISA